MRGLTPLWAMMSPAENHLSKKMATLSKTLIYKVTFETKGVIPGPDPESTLLVNSNFTLSGGSPIKPGMTRMDTYAKKSY